MNSFPCDMRLMMFTLIKVISKGIDEGKSGLSRPKPNWRIDFRSSRRSQAQPVLDSAKVEKAFRSDFPNARKVTCELLANRSYLEDEATGCRTCFWRIRRFMPSCDHAFSFSFYFYFPIRHTFTIYIRKQDYMSVQEPPA